MSQRKAYSFRVSEMMDAHVNEICRERKLDRTSVVRLALYSLSAYMKEDRVKEMNLYDIVNDLESRTPTDFPKFSDFCAE